MGVRYIQYDDLTAEQKHFFLTYVYNKIRIREFPIDVVNYTFERANMIHDFAYWSGGKERHRRRADRRYLFSLLKETIQRVKFKYWLKFIIGIFGFYLQIRSFGRFSFAYYDRPAVTWKEFFQRCDCLVKEV